MNNLYLIFYGVIGLSLVGSAKAITSYIKYDRLIRKIKTNELRKDVRHLAEILESRNGY